MRLLSRIGGNTSYALTEAGRKKAHEFSISTPKMEVLAALSDNSPATARDIAIETGKNTNMVKLILRTLVREGYVRGLGSDED